MTEEIIRAQATNLSEPVWTSSRDKLQRWRVSFDSCHIYRHLAGRTRRAESWTRRAESCRVGPFTRLAARQVASQARRTTRRV